MYEPKSYSQIKEDLQKLNLLENIRTEIVMCVWASLIEVVNSSRFDLLCQAVYNCWTNAVNSVNLQILADIVVDLYQDCGYGYRGSEKIINVFCEEGEVKIPCVFTDEDLENFNYKHRWLVYLLESERD